MNAAQGSQAEIWVRVPLDDQAYIKRILDREPEESCARW